jgi:hypothetical protein
MNGLGHKPAAQFSKKSNLNFGLELQMTKKDLEIMQNDYQKLHKYIAMYFFATPYLFLNIYIT